MIRLTLLELKVFANLAFIGGMNHVAADGKGFEDWFVDFLTKRYSEEMKDTDTVEEFLDKRYE
jgi:hypothetical protein